jgi:glutamate dehydrogenase (NAD(P)+)
MLDLIETTFGKKLDPTIRSLIGIGADEEHLVYSGLEDTMINACAEVRRIALEKNVDYRMAAMYSSIKKIAECTDTSGMIFMK